MRDLRVPRNESTPVKQAIRAANNLNSTGQSRHTADKKDGLTRSYGTLRVNKDIYSVASKWAADQPDIKRFKDLTPAQAERFLVEKSVDLSNKSIASYAVSLEHHLKHNCGCGDVKLERPDSEITHIRSSRAYTPEAISYLQSQQTGRAALSTAIMRESGLRAHELHTLRGIDERGPSDRRQWRDDRFAGREGWVRYTVAGKGGLVREIALSPQTSERLEAVRREAVTVTDRGIEYRSVYNLMGGKSYSNSFSKLSDDHLGHSHGAHGIRHTYAQERMKELGNAGYSYEDSKLIVSQELGHFRPSITDYYLR